MQHIRRVLFCKLWGTLILFSLLTAGCSYPTKSLQLPTNEIPKPELTPTTAPTFTTTASQTPSLTPTHTPTIQPSSTATIQPSYTPTPQPLTFAVIGDYGVDNNPESDVANLILSWQPDLIITVGDNNYPYGGYDTIDAAIGKYFHSYIYPYTGSYGDGATLNRFFPCLGNHDLHTDDGQPYYDYFTLPGNERYYDFIWGPVHFFALNDVESEPDGVGISSIQAAWLQSKLVASTSAWNIVYMHYPPYSSGLHGSTDWARWPYKEWGADAVLAGHDHVYERLEQNGLTYFVNGLGGNGIYDFENIVEGSLVRYNGDYGAMRVDVTGERILFQFINRSSDLVDSYEIRK